MSPVKSFRVNSKEALVKYTGPDASKKLDVFSVRGYNNSILEEGVNEATLLIANDGKNKNFIGEISAIVAGIHDESFQRQTKPEKKPFRRK